MKQTRRISFQWSETALGCGIGVLVFAILAAASGFALMVFSRAASANGSADGARITNSRATPNGTTAGATPASAGGGVPVSGALPPAAENPTPLSAWSMVQPDPSRTPFQPQTYTPTPSTTPTATATPTPTSTPTATSTSTALPTNTATPTDTPIPPTPTPSDGLPEEAWVSGVTGYAQTLPLSCEARSAVDWARYFGVNIGEMAFQNGLPVTENPNTGFVGNPRDERGSIPPDSYGAHPPPVARLLRVYGVNARSRQGMDWQDVRREIASGEPVIAWVIGNVWTSMRAVSYTAPDGETLLVAPYEHTVIIVGYTPTLVSVVDNDLRYSVPVEDFLASWGVLGNLAIVKE